MQGSGYKCYFQLKDIILETQLFMRLAGTTTMGINFLISGKVEDVHNLWSSDSTYSYMHFEKLKQMYTRNMYRDIYSSKQIGNNLIVYQQDNGLIVV